MVVFKGSKSSKSVELGLTPLGQNTTSSKQAKIIYLPFGCLCYVGPTYNFFCWLYLLLLYFLGCHCQVALLRSYFLYCLSFSCLCCGCLFYGCFCCGFFNRRIWCCYFCRYCPICGFLPRCCPFYGFFLVIVFVVGIFVVAPIGNLINNVFNQKSQLISNLKVWRSDPLILSLI